MATKEEDFRERFVAMMQDLHANGGKDQEAMFLIGSLASRLMDRTSAKSWTTFKSTLGSYDRSALITDFEKQGNKFHKDGKRKHAHAVQAHRKVRHRLQERARELRKQSRKGVADRAG